jgi:hypothetical protein
MKLFRNAVGFEERSAIRPSRRMCRPHWGLSERRALLNRQCRSQDEPRPLRRPLGLSSPTVPLFSRAGAGDLRPHRPQPTARLDGQCLRRSRHRRVPRFNFRCAGVTGGTAAPKSS